MPLSEDATGLPDPPVLTTNKYRSREQQVPFSRRISTVLAKEGGGHAQRTAPHGRPASPLQEPQDPGQLTTRLDHPGLIGGHEPVIAQLTVLNPHAVRLEEVDAA